MHPYHCCSRSHGTTSKKLVTVTCFVEIIDCHLPSFLILKDEGIVTIDHTGSTVDDNILHYFSSCVFTFDAVMEVIESRMILMSILVIFNGSVICRLSFKFFDAYSKSC